MRKVLFSVAFAVLALTPGCQSSPPNAPSPAAGAANVGPLSRLFGSKPSNSPATAAAQNKDAKAPNGVALSKKTKQDLAIESVMKRGGTVQVDFNGMEKFVVVADLHGFRNAAAALESLAPLTMLRDVNLHATSINDADLVVLRGLPNLQNLNLSGTKVGDAGLQLLQTLPNLRTLNLNETRVTDAGVQYLRSMANLSDLSLYGTKVTDQGLTQLRNSQALHKLVLGGSNSITDRGLNSLRDMPQLRDLTILSSRVTDSGIEDLKIACTQLKVTR